MGAFWFLILKFISSYTALRSHNTDYLSNICIFKCWLLVECDSHSSTGKCPSSVHLMCFPWIKSHHITTMTVSYLRRLLDVTMVNLRKSQQKQFLSWYRFLPTPLLHLHCFWKNFYLFGRSELSRLFLWKSMLFCLPFFLQLLDDSWDGENAESVQLFKVESSLLGFW